jgi:hypothetical protein
MEMLQVYSGNRTHGTNAMHPLKLGDTENVLFDLYALTNAFVINIGPQSYCPWTLRTYMACLE